MVYRARAEPYPQATNYLPNNKQFRPEEIEWWMRRGRKYNRTPQIKDVAAFGASWMDWWAKMQPPRRGTTWPFPHTPLRDQWQWNDLRKGGSNGLFLAIISLSWWLAEAVEVQGDLSDVKVALADVTWCLEQMHAKPALTRSVPEDGFAEETRVSKRRKV